MSIFDPLSVIIKLAILSKKPLGTKISVKNYIIIIQEKTFYQSYIRYINNDNKFDIENLINPIKIACDIYLKKNNKKISDIKILFRNAQNGLYKLIKLYNKYPIIIYCLKYANIIIEIYINKLIKSELSLNYNNNLSSINDKILTLKKSLSGNSLKNMDTSYNKKINNNLESSDTFSKVPSINNLNELHNSSPKVFSRSYSTNNLNELTNSKVTNTYSNIKIKSPDKLKDITSPKVLSKSSSYNNDLIYNNKSTDINKLNDENIKNMSRCSSANDLNSCNIPFSRSTSVNETSDLLSFQNNLKKIKYRFGASGYFLFNEDDDNGKICDDIIDNLNKVDYYNNLIIQDNITINELDDYSFEILNLLNTFWCDEKINDVIKLLDNYINSDLIMIKNRIEKLMDDIDNLIVILILNYRNDKNY